MGLVQDNHGKGRVYEGGWRIQAWVGNGGSGLHTCIDLGPLNATSIAAYQTACGIAHTSGQSAWEAHMASAVSGWSSWYGGLSSARQAGLYECARAAGEHGLTP